MGKPAANALRRDLLEEQSARYTNESELPFSKPGRTDRAVTWRRVEPPPETSEPVR
ncbi:MAG TPA: hypothetical protein VFV02_15280 [Acidimicrobiales bacterium]|nr:hypothetical protein [Acidimicrobiales bacterium]